MTRVISCWLRTRPAVTSRQCSWLQLRQRCIRGGQMGKTSTQKRGWLLSVHPPKRMLSWLRLLAWVLRPSSRQRLCSYQTGQQFMQALAGGGYQVANMKQ